MTEISSQNLSLNESPLLKDLTSDELQCFSGYLERLHFEAGSVIVEQGTENNGLWLVERGSCEVIRLGKAGQKNQVLATLGGGAVFGEMSFFQKPGNAKAVHSANIRCVSDVDVYQLTQSAFDKLQTSSCLIASKVLKNLVHVLADRLHSMDQWVCELIEQESRKESSRQDEWHEFRAKLYSEWDFS